MTFDPYPWIFTTDNARQKAIKIYWLLLNGKTTKEIKKTIQCGDGIIIKVRNQLKIQRLKQNKRNSIKKRCMK